MALGIIQALESAGSVENSDRIYADIHEVADTLRSLAVSIREAAFRQDEIWLRIYRAEFVQQAHLLVGLIRDIAPLKREKARAA